MEKRLFDVLVESAHTDLQNITDSSKEAFQGYDILHSNFRFASGFLCLLMLIAIGIFCFYSQWNAAIVLFCFASSAAYFFQKAHAQMLEIRDTAANMTNGVYKYAVAIIKANEELKELELKRKDG